MTEDTKEALIGSIKKWHDILYNDGVDDSDKNCPLCKMFYDDNCAGCPVSIDTGKTFCSGSPYAKWAIITFMLEMPFTLENVLSINLEAKDVAEAELEYLKSLLKQ